MFGLTVEKLLLVAVVAGILIGPQRLPHHAHELARLVRSFRAFVEATRARAEQETGLSMKPAEWDLTQYDPRRIVREAMSDLVPADVADTPGPESKAWDDIVEQAARVRPGQKYLVVGTAAHPRRILIDSLAPTDPRRVAAEMADADVMSEA